MVPSNRGRVNLFNDKVETLIACNTYYEVHVEGRTYIGVGLK